MPEPFQGVEGTLLDVLDVHHQVQIVKQHPAALPFAFAPDRPGVKITKLLLNAVDHGRDLAFIAGADDQEDVGDRQLLGNVVGDDVGAELVGSRSGRDVRQLQRPFGGSQDVPFFRTDVRPGRVVSVIRTGCG